VTDKPKKGSASGVGKPHAAVDLQHEVWDTSPYVIVIFDGQHLGLNAKDDGEAIHMTKSAYRSFPLSLWRTVPRQEIYSQE
jgi:hypothetical protein